MARRYQTDSISIGIRETLGFCSVLTRNDQFSVAAGRSDRKLIDMMVDLDHRSCGVMPVLLLTTADRKNVVEPETHVALPEVKHWIEIVG
jgi:hypothetical protein